MLNHVVAAIFLLAFVVCAGRPALAEMRIADPIGNDQMSDESILKNWVREELAARDKKLETLKTEASVRDKSIETLKDTVASQGIRIQTLEADSAPGVAQEPLAQKPRRGLQASGTSACIYDVIKDGRVDVADLLQLLTQFHMESCVARADFNADCIVNVADLLELLSAFGGAVSDSDCNMAHIDDGPSRVLRRWLQVTAEGRTTAEYSAGPPAVCTVSIVGAVYFDGDAAEFRGCNGAAWEPLGGSNSGDSGDSHFMCANGYAGSGCSRDATRPEITCPEHTVAIQMPNAEYKLTSAHIPRPWVYDTGPGIPGNLMVTLGLYDDNNFDETETTVDPLVTWQ
jgi:hypothetical protein